MGDAALIPDRRRKYFPRNGGPRPTRTDRQRGRKGLAAARAALARAIPGKPADHTVIKRHTPEQAMRARDGIAAARDALEHSTDDHGSDKPSAAA